MARKKKLGRTTITISLSDEAACMLDGYSWSKSWIVEAAIRRFGSMLHKDQEEAVMQALIARNEQVPPPNRDPQPGDVEQWTPEGMVRHE